MQDIKVTIFRNFFRKDGTFGALAVNNLPICLTLEREWLDNITGKSCIPSGVYTCRRVQSPKFGDTFEVCDVPGRTHILFHGGNIDDDSHGCIILGEQYNIWRDGSCSITSSRVAVAEFMQMLAAVDSFELTISETR